MNFFATEDRGGKFDTNFVHADESETAVALLAFLKGMVDMSKAVSTVGKGVSHLPGGHFDTSVDPYRCPHKWSEGQGHFAIELYAPRKAWSAMPRRPLRKRPNDRLLQF